MKTLMLTIILVTGLSIVGQSCDCDGARRSIEELLKKSNNVFIGTVKSVEPADDKKSDTWTYETIEFEIIEIFTGEPTKTLKVQNENSDCGLFFEKGKQYLLYVYLDKRSGKLRIDQCFSPCPDLSEREGKDELSRVRKIAGARP